MSKSTDIKKLGELVAAAQRIVVAGPDHIDGDSLSSLLAFEEIFGDMGKDVILYTGGRVEPYLKYLEGWDRVTDVWPDQYDLAISPDLGAPSGAPRLLEKYHATLRSKPWVVLDHHIDRTPIDGVSLDLADTSAAATTELIYECAKKLKWPLNSRACKFLVSGLFADTLNLTTPSVTPKTVRTFADLVELGDLKVNELHAAFREMSAIDSDLLHLKGELLEAVELHHDGKIAIVIVSEAILKEYRDRVNPSALLFNDMLWARGVQVAVIINDYANVKRAMLRSRLPIAGPVAVQFGGGGHPMAAAFPTEGKSAADIKTELIAALITELDK